jgi:hypothetical protein
LYRATCKLVPGMSYALDQLIANRTSWQNLIVADGSSKS